jgi:hypothetical protein
MQNCVSAHNIRTRNPFHLSNNNKKMMMSSKIAQAVVVGRSGSMVVRGMSSSARFSLPPVKGEEAKHYAPGNRVPILLRTLRRIMHTR